MHPSFVRGNKALCAAMGRHVLPTFAFSNFGQSLSEVTNQFKLQQPKLVALGEIHRIGAQPLNRGEWDTNTDDNPTKDKPANILDSQNYSLSTRVCQQIYLKDLEKDNSLEMSHEKPTNGHVHQTYSADSLQGNPLQCPLTTDSIRCQQYNDNEHYSGTREPNSCDSIEAKTSEGEDWRLLSACLDRIINRKESKRTATDAPPPGLNSDRHYLPLDAIAPGMEEPATPENVQFLFVELSGESETSPPHDI
jgi:hypothetical protein